MDADTLPQSEQGGLDSGFKVWGVGTGVENWMRIHYRKVSRGDVEFNYYFFVFVGGFGFRVVKMQRKVDANALPQGGRTGGKEGEGGGGQTHTHTRMQRNALEYFAAKVSSRCVS